MIVSRKSWHYRLHTFVFTVFNIADFGPLSYLRGKRYDHQPKTLCGYFWSTTTLVALAPVFLLVFFLIGLPIAALVIGLFKAHEGYRAVRPKPTEPTKTGLLLEYAGARKKQLCPLITLSD